MSRQIQIRRGSATEHNNFTGAIGEITMDTTNKTLRVHDGETIGGNEMMSTNKFYSNITNCITEIPQDIKVSFSGSTLTIKSGSKIYYPNGSGVFNTVTLTEDETYSASGSGVFFILRRNAPGTSGYYGEMPNNITSGTVDSSTNGVLYDKTNNRIDYYTSGTRGDRLFSFPICKITVSNGTIKSIDHVFNGFGYIGSTIFVLPGLKAFAPDGLNKDGTLKCAVALRTTVGIFTLSNPLNAAGYTITLKDGINTGMGTFFGRPYFQEIYPGNNYKYWYKPSENKAYNSQTGQGTETQSKSAYLFYFNPTNGDCTFNQVFRALDCNPEFITTMSMPSKRYIDLTLGTSGSYYTARADGYYIISKQSVSANEYITLLNTVNNFGIDEFCPAGMNARLFMPVSKGDVIQVNYTLTGTTGFFRFVYANGAQ